MHLGAFSISLAVQDLEKSAAFYQALGFESFHGQAEHGFMILKQGETILGLFQGHIEKNTLTFNPGWDQGAQPLEDFLDVREIQKSLKANGIEVDVEVDVTGSGPGHIMLRDPDGNPVLIDQHV